MSITITAIIIIYAFKFMVLLTAHYYEKNKQ